MRTVVGALFFGSGGGIDDVSLAVASLPSPPPSLRSSWPVLLAREASAASSGWSSAEDDDNDDIDGSGAAIGTAIIPSLLCRGA